MQYINVSTLKRQAKRNRKNNLNIKNHAESLNLVAQEYNFDKWEDLIDNSVLLIQSESKSKENNKNQELAESLIEITVWNISNRLEEINEIMTGEDYNYLATKIHEICISQPNNEENNVWVNNAFSLMKVICFIFYKTTKDNSDYKYLHSLLNRKTLMTIIEDNFKEFMEYSIISNFIENILISYIQPTPANPSPEQNSTMEEQYSYLTMQYAVKFGTLIEELEVFKHSSKKEIIEELKNPKPVLAYSIFLDKERNFVKYMRILLGKDVSFYNKEFKKKNIELLNELGNNAT